MATDEEQVQFANFCRLAASYLDKFERYESQELLSRSSAHWLLSGDGHRAQKDSMQDIAASISLSEENTTIILFPVDDDCSPLCYREIHQIVRELTVGIFVFNQTPNITLEANFDQATVCNIPPAYLDTRVGQILINVDYMLKALWHGAFIPRDKRVKFAERWREIFDVDAHGQPDARKSLYVDFQIAGLIDITRDPAYAKVYDSLPKDILGDAEMDEERVFFNSYADDISMNLTFYQDKVEYYENMFIVSSDYSVSSNVYLLDTQIDNNSYERLKMRLQMHEIILQKHLAAKPEVKRQLELLKLISFLVPFLIGIRKRMKIPDIQKLLPAFSSEDCRTEREFPPLILGPDFKCKNFKFPNQYFHLHGGISFDMETNPLVEASEPFITEYPDIVQMAEKELYKHLKLELPLKDFFNTPACTVDGKKYYAIMIQMETFYGSSPQRPLWVRAFHDEIDKLKPKRLPISDIHVHEQFKKFAGYKWSIKYKTPLAGIKYCAQRGMVSIFNSLNRKITGVRVGKQDEQGLSLIHHAAMYNRPQIISCIILNGMEIDVRRSNFMASEYKKAVLVSKNLSSIETLLAKYTEGSYALSAKPSLKHADGLTALHIAARCGSLDAASCLISNHANILANDQDGWTPVHYAAYFDHKHILRLLVRSNTDLLNVPTKNALCSTPLLLAASSGALSAVKCLISLDADIRATDSEDNGLVTLAALRFHTNILEYLTDLDHPDISVWKILVEMLYDSNIVKQDSAVKCLEILSTAKPDNWKSMLDAGSVPALIKLLQVDNIEMQSVTAAVLCNISDNDLVRLALTEADAVPALVQLLLSPLDEVQARAAILISDIALVGQNQQAIAKCGGIEYLVALFDSDLEDVLVNVVNAVRVLCIDNRDNQGAFAKCGGLEYLVEFLDLPSIDLQAGAAAALAAVVNKNTDIQNYAMGISLHKPVVSLISSRSVTVQVKAASALEAAATNHFNSQQRFLELDAPKALIRLLKNVHVEVREQGACSLWSLAGNTKTQQKYIAERITIPHVVQLLVEPTEKLLYVGCMVTIALGSENMANQNKLAATETFSVLVRLLRSPKTSLKVLLMVVKVVGILCIGVAFRNNKVTQLKFAEEEGIPVLTQLFLHPPSEEIQVEAAISLACVTLCCKENHEKLIQDPKFSYFTLLSLLRHKEPDIQLRAGMALTIFAFNSPAQQYALREAGGLKFNFLQKFIESSDEFYQCYGAFQSVVLARVIVDKDQVWLTAQGIEHLVSKLNSEDKVVMLACSLLSSLAHTRAGLTDAMVSVGVLDLLVKKITSRNEMVRNAVAIMLGYLTFNRTAYRLLFSICRNMPGLYQKIMDNIGEEHYFNEEFSINFKLALAVGLPSQCLEINGGQPIKRPRTAVKKKWPVTTESKNKSGHAISSHTGVSAPSNIKFGHTISSRTASAPSKLGMNRSKPSFPSVESESQKIKYTYSGTSFRDRPQSTTNNFSSKTSSVI